MEKFMPDVMCAEGVQGMQPVILKFWALPRIDPHLQLKPKPTDNHSSSRKQRAAHYLEAIFKAQAREEETGPLQTQMKVPFLLAWLSGMSPYRLKNEGFFEEPPTKKADSVPLLPPVEVLPSEVPKTNSFVPDILNLENGLTLLKGRAHNGDFSNVDSTGAKFEGGLRLSKCAVELVNILRREIQDGQLSFRGKRVLELGCGHGLPGIFACLKGAAEVHFQDLSSELLRNVTIPNVAANLEHAQSQHAHISDGGLVRTKTSQQLRPELHYYAGHWSGMDSVLSVVRQDHYTDSACQCDRSGSADNLSTGKGSQIDYNQEIHLQSRSLKGIKHLPSSSRACERGNLSGSLEGGYDIILMSETVHAGLTLPTLYSLVVKCLRSPYGVMYVAGKKHYYGSGGGTRQFKSLADADGLLGAHLIADFTDASFNTKEVWKFFFH
ncbi:hypothetical protein L7F22_049073 [Adiantum nelumboides]|nr:hypothetical protein [Adiantum nelumboides]